ncbi:MAG: hypothetical protein HN337_00760 [Deltaproteobacteria bacterium]|nr:hypothetical protein [Deltaproteobacteria bacterium]
MVDRVPPGSSKVTGPTQPKDIVRDQVADAVDLAASTYAGKAVSGAPVASSHIPTGPLGLSSTATRRINSLPMDILTALGSYPRSQAEYFAELAWKFLTEGGSSGDITTDLTEIDFFARMDDAIRAEHIWELSDLSQDASLLELASQLTVADLQMNGGLGSGMGLDPRDHHSKVTGVEITLDLPEAGEVTVPIMTAKLEMYARMAKLFGAYHLVMLNSTITRDGWASFIESPFPGATETMGERATRHGIMIKPEVIQHAFPLLNRGSKKPIQTDEPDMAVASGGHGQFIFELYFSGRLKEMVDEGVDVIFFGNADNFQSKPSPLISAKLIREGKMGVMVSTDRTSIDTVNGGIFGLKYNHLTIVEYKESSAAQRKLFKGFGLVEGDKPQPFNTNSIYLNASRLLTYLDAVNSVQGDRAVRELLTPNLIAGSKPREVSGEMIQAAHLEGAIGSVVLKLPDVAIANVAANARTTQFAPIKRPYEVVMIYDSDAFALELEGDGLRKQGFQLPPTFNIGGWDGWKDLAQTRHALGRPSIQQLESLSIHGPVLLPGAILSGHVVINNTTGSVVDLTSPTLLASLPQHQGVLNLSNVAIQISSAGMMVQPVPALL